MNGISSMGNDVYLWLGFFLVAVFGIFTYCLRADDLSFGLHVVLFGHLLLECVLLTFQSTKREREREDKEQKQIIMCVIEL